MKYLVVLLLAGCALTPEERADRAMQKYAPYCERLGYERGTAVFAGCVENQELAARRRGTVCNTFGNTTVCN